MAYKLWTSADKLSSLCQRTDCRLLIRTSQQQVNKMNTLTHRVKQQLTSFITVSKGLKHNTVCAVHWCQQQLVLLHQPCVADCCVCSFSLASVNSCFTLWSSSGSSRTSRAVMARAFADLRVKNWAAASPATKTQTHWYPEKCMLTK